MRKLDIVKFRGFLGAVGQQLNNRFLRTQSEEEVEMYLQAKKNRITPKKIAQVCNTDDFMEILDLVWTKMKIRDEDFKRFPNRLSNFLKTLEKKLQDK